ncbi:MAG TPA: phytoene desaturase [Caldithrix sp.]|nr:phytoene desaturase [Bacteroidales bacterium]HEM49538.1 phytoene desaturase [Caldithrix sp.]
MDNKTAVIVGAGIGGIATSVFLARNGYKVKVYEKNEFPGGRCSGITRDGHRFDMGATIYLMPSIYRSVFESMGLKIEDCFQSLPLNTLYKVYFEDGTEIPFSANNVIMQSSLEETEPGSYQKARRYISTGYGFFELAMKKLIGRNFYHLFDFITISNMILLMKLKTYIRHIAFARKFFRHPHLVKAFTFQNIYVGQDPNKAPALFAMIPAAELTEGSLVPAGGMYKITEALISHAEKLGVQFFYGKAVSRIKVNKRMAEGVVLEDGEETTSDIVVANADLPYVYHELLPDRRISKRIERLKYSCSAIVIHWGLDKTYPQLGHHSVFLSDNYNSNLNCIFKDHSISDDPSFYIHAPSRTDPTAAPDGEDTLTVIIPSGHADEKKPQDWNERLHKVRQSVINRLKKLGLTDIDDHIKFEFSYLPHDWKNIFNLSKGATFGSLGHNIFQMGYFRPHNRHKKYRNLYFAGGSTHPGNGIPLVLLSAKLTTERILKDLP